MKKPDREIPPVTAKELPEILRDVMSYVIVDDDENIDTYLANEKSHPGSTPGKMLAAKNRRTLRRHLKRFIGIFYYIMENPYVDYPGPLYKKYFKKIVRDLAKRNQSKYRELLK